MPRQSNFIGRDQLPKPDYSLRPLQALPELVRSALASATQDQIAGREVTPRDVAQWMIDRYDVNQVETIGRLLEVMEDFISDSVQCRMIRCYVDQGCNMVRAKLAWQEDY